MKSETKKSWKMMYANEASRYGNSPVYRSKDMKGVSPLVAQAIVAASAQQSHDRQRDIPLHIDENFVDPPILDVPFSSPYSKGPRLRFNNKRIISDDARKKKRKARKQAKARHRRARS